MIDHDRLYKELIRTFIREFIEAFLGEVAQFIDLDSIVFLDKEIFTDLDAADRNEVDLLLKVRVKGLGEVYILIHIENESTARAGHPMRMFDYFAVLFRRHRLPILPVTIYSYARPRQPVDDHFRIAVPGFVVNDFHFKAIQLNQLNWRDYLRKPNPVANAFLTRMNIAPEDRPRVKWEFLRMLATLKLDKAKSRLIATFMETYLKLSAEENAVYNRVFEAQEAKEKESVMILTNEWIEKGKEEGRQEGQQSLILRLLKKRFRGDALPTEVADRVCQLSASQLDSLGEALFDFADVSDLEKWIGRQN